MGVRVGLEVGRVTRIAVCVSAIAVAALARVSGSAAAEPKLRDVVSRVGTYVVAYQQRLATIVAEEQYRQAIEDTSRIDSTGHGELIETRLLRSDYALVRAPDGDGRVGFRDTFEVDGAPVRGREDRLQRMIATGEIAEAARVANESARFNLGEFVVRNVNVPTFALRLLHPLNRDRFSFKKVGEQTIAGTRTWEIEFRERDRPTIVRTPEGRAQPSFGSVWVNPDSGEVWKTLVMWDVQGLTSFGRVTVTYDRVAGLDAIVPVRMEEAYPSPRMLLRADASYANFRVFQTTARVVR